MYFTPELTVVLMSALLGIVLYALKHWLSRVERKIDLLVEHHADVDRRVSRLEGARH